MPKTRGDTGAAGATIAEGDTSRDKGPISSATVVCAFAPKRDQRYGILALLLLRVQDEEGVIRPRVKTRTDWSQ